MLDGWQSPELNATGKIIFALRSIGTPTGIYFVRKTTFVASLQPWKVTQRNIHVLVQMIQGYIDLYPLSTGFSSTHTTTSSALSWPDSSPGVALPPHCRDRVQVLVRPEFIRHFSLLYCCLNIANCEDHTHSLLSVLGGYSF